MDKKKEIQKLLQKVSESKKGKLDLSSDEDLSIAVMNLVSIEEHFFFTGAKTDKSEYFELLNKTREIRKELLKKLIKNPEGEVWCLSKHLLAASMRLMEVGTKQLHKGDKKEAEDFFKKSFDLYSLFWGINLGAIKTSDVKKIEDNQLNVHDKSKNGVLGKLGELVKKIVDCCIE